ncbi:MAG: hypothetical protein ACI8XB_000034 [Patiriisocius sp.]|jgi:hypothetical protein
MLKSLIITGHLFGIFLLSFLFSDEITITDTFPDSLKVGENYTVTTSVIKNDVSGFAKYQIDAPRGVVIKPIDLNGASFTFKDGKAKFIWMNLPSTPAFDIRYEVSLEDGEIGSDKVVNSRLSYLVENERKIHDGPNHLLKVLGDNLTAVNTQSSTTSEISATRKITAEGDNKFLVEIEVNKLGVKGFAKIQDMIPDGFIASEVMNSEAIFTQSNNKVKLVWFDIPKNISLKITYQLEAPMDFQGNAEIAGKFHYMAGSDLKKIDVPSTSISIGDVIADNSAPKEDITSSMTNDGKSSETTLNNSSNNDLATNNTDNTTSSETTKKSIWDTNYNADKMENSTSSVNNEVAESTETALVVAESITSPTENKVIDDKILSTETNSLENLADNAISNTSDNVNDNIESTESDGVASINNVPKSTKANTMDDLMDGNNPTPANNDVTTTNINNDADLATSNNNVNTTRANSMDGNSPTPGNNDVVTTNNTSTDTHDVSDDPTSTTDSIEEEVNIADETIKSELVDTYIDDKNNISTKKAADVIDNTKSETNLKTDDSSSEYANINNMASTVNTSVKAPKTADMTTAIAEPESTAVAKKEYAKDEVLADANTLNNVSNMTDVDKGINFRIQILAGKNVVGKEYLQKKHSYYSQFTIENHKGWVKYTSGSFETYKTARDQRNTIRDQYNFDGPFVSAYNDGVRITVQEALMISKQQWYN